MASESESANDTNNLKAENTDSANKEASTDDSASGFSEIQAQFDDMNWKALLSDSNAKGNIFICGFV